MALSGSHTGAKVGQFSLRIDWSATQNTAANTSTITANAYIVIGSGWSIQIGERTGVITIDGTSTTIKYTLGLKTAGTHWIGSASKTITHNGDGTRSFAISGSARLEASITGYGWVGTVYRDSVTYTLDTIPRYAAITGFSASISGLTASLSWTADRTISYWRYSTNSGSSYSGWIAVSASKGSTSFSVSPGSTYGFRVQVRNSASGLDTTSSTLSRTAPTYAGITGFSASINDRSASLSWTANKTITQWRYSTNSGSSYSGWTTVNAKSGSRSSISVSPGSTYGFRIQVIDSETGLTTTSSTLSRTATKTPSTLTRNTTSQNVGSSITWTINESYDYTHKITYAFGNTSGYILGSGSAASNTASGTWTLPTGLANQIPNATSGVGTIYLYTYYGNVHVGTNSYSFTATVPNNTTWQPTVPSVTISDAGSRPTGITSYVQGMSKVKAVSSSTARGGASISSYRVTVSDVGTYYGGNITSGWLNKSGTVTVTVRATDSRGYYREKSDTITVVEYLPPRLSSYNARRGPNDQGTNLSAYINFSISPINNQNTKQYRIRYRPTGGGWVVLVDSTDYYTRSTTHSATSVLNQNNSYEVEFYIKDSYTSVTQTVQVATAFTLIDFNASGRGMAIGKVSEKNAFEIGMSAFDKNGAEIVGLQRGRIPEGSNLHETPEGVYQLVGEYVMGTGSSMSGILIVLDPNPNSDSSGKTMIYISRTNGMWTKTYWGGWSGWMHYARD